MTSISLYDSYGRLRTSVPMTLFDADHVGRRNIAFDTSGSWTHDVTNSTVHLESSGNVTAISQSKYIFAYQPGKSLLIILTFVMSNSSTSTERVGYFSASHGIYLEKAAGVYSFVVRKSSGVENRVTQSNWNGRQLSTGSTVIDFSKTQEFWCEIAWLGAGTVRCGFIMDGVTVTCHTFHHANDTVTTYMKSAKLPVRYEITEPGATTVSMAQICSTVVSEGGHELLSIPKSIGKYNGVLAVTDERSLISIRLHSDYINDIIVVLSHMDILATGTSENRAIYYKLVLNPTVPGDTVWSDISDSAVQYTESVDLSTGGMIIHSGYVSAGLVVNLDPTARLNIQLGRTIDNVSDVITLRAGAAVGVPNAASSISWYEI